jgi:hypothetical protein
MVCRCKTNVKLRFSLANCNTLRMYGAFGDGGVAPADLDDCNGHRDTSNPFYHYHVTPNMQYVHTPSRNERM